MVRRNLFYLNALFAQWVAPQPTLVGPSDARAAFEAALFGGEEMEAEEEMVIDGGGGGEGGGGGGAEGQERQKTPIKVRREGYKWMDGYLYGHVSSVAHACTYIHVQALLNLLGTVEGARGGRHQAATSAGSM